MQSEHDQEVPESFPVKVLITKEQRSAALIPMGCGTCGRWWDDAISTDLTPVPSGRCPFEYFHQEDDPRWPHPVAILDGIADVIIAHNDIRIAVLDPTNPGFGVNCRCGKNFPFRNPDKDWVPKELSKEEWDEYSDEDKDEFIRIGWGGEDIRVKMAVRDYYRHMAECILQFLRPVD
jgi:hypothetical protein